MRSMTSAGICACIVICLCAPVGVFAALFSEDFEVDPTASWTVNNGPSDEAHNLFFDYSTVGIPQAPSGAGTRGMKLQANLTNGIFSGMSVSPTGQSFTGNYTLTFDLWSNINGPFPVGGSGSTNLSIYGVMTAGTNAQWPGGTSASSHDSIWFAYTGDGNSFADYRAYSPTEPAGYDGTEMPNVYAAALPDSRSSAHAYYSSFGALSAPAAQLALFPQQTGTTVVGSGGMAWHQVVIDVSGSIITWRMDNLLIATVDTTGMTFGGSNILFGHSDVNATSPLDPNAGALLFTLIDNIEVTPEPATLSLLAWGGLLLARRCRA